MFDWPQGELEKGSRNSHGRSLLFLPRLFVQVVSSSSPARAAADRVAAHLGLRLLGWASLRPPRIRSSDLDVKSDGDEDKKKAGKNELSLRWKERRREGARQIVYGRREKSESEDARGPEARRGSEGGTEEERSQDKVGKTPKEHM